MQSTSEERPVRKVVISRVLPAAALSLAGNLLANPVLAQSAVSINSSTVVEGTSTPGYLSDRFSLSVGTFIVSSKLDSTLKGNATTANAPVDFSRDFGMDNGNGIFRTDALWRITPKHDLRFVWFHHDTNRNRTFDHDITWGDYTFLANGSISADSKLDVYELSYEYAFIRRPTFQLAAGGGVHVLNMSIKLAGQATVTDANGSVTQASYSSSNSSLPAPLPVIGARAAWAVTPNIFIEPEAQWLSFHYDGYHGSWWDLRVAGKWMFSRHFGLGLGYDYFHANLDVEKARFNGNVTLGYSGLQAMIVGSY
jgi:hypothetical protein